MWERVKNVPLKMQENHKIIIIILTVRQGQWFLELQKSARGMAEIGSPKCLSLILRRPVLTCIKHFKYMYILGTNNEVQG